MNVRTLFALAICGACASASLGRQADRMFTVRAPSPTGLQQNFIYASPGGVPILVGGGLGTGTPQPLDHIDGISKNVDEGHLDAHKEWVIWFSVDSDSVGLPPDSWMDVLPPFSVSTEASVRQHRSDIYMSTEGYRLQPDGRLPVPPSMGLFNNGLVVNQSAVYPHFWGLLPIASPGVLVGVGVPQDELDGGARGHPPGPGEEFYFTLSTTSPSLPLVVPGTVPSGANIFFDPDINLGGNEGLYASFAALGLQFQNDDIDGLVVLDSGVIGVYDGEDVVVFTLARGSPSLAIFGSPANVLISRFGVVSVMAFHFELGLSEMDHIDALDLVEIIGESVLLTIETEVGPPFLCRADLTTSAVLGAVGFGVPDGVLNSEDFFYYLWAFGEGILAIADLTTTAVPGSPGYGVPDGILSSEDFFYYLMLYVSGC